MLACPHIPSLPCRVTIYVYPEFDVTVTVGSPNRLVVGLLERPYLAPKAKRAKLRQSKFKLFYYEGKQR